MQQTPKHTGPYLFPRCGRARDPGERQTHTHHVCLFFAPCVFFTAVLVARRPTLEESLEDFTEGVGRVPTVQLKKALVGVYQVSK